MRPNVNTQTALTLPGPIPLQKGVGPGDEASVVPPLSYAIDIIAPPRDWKHDHVSA